MFCNIAPFFRGLSQVLCFHEVDDLKNKKAGVVAALAFREIHYLQKILSYTEKRCRFLRRKI